MRKHRRKSIIGILIGSILAMSLLGFAAYSIFYMLSDTSSTESDKDILSVEPKPKPTVSYIDYLQESGVFELPVNGASGYASIAINLHKSPRKDTNTITTLNAGQGFTILEESGDWWQIEFDGKTGWVMHQYCLISLPDVIPSIIYDNSNAYSSKMKSSGREIPNITGEALYQTYMYNEEMYVMPVLYAMASKISAAQQAALAEGNTLIIYEAFRPYDVQQKIVKNLSALVDTDPAVKAGLTKPPWSMGWFIATGISNHQRGYAIDVSLGKIIKQETKTTGSYTYKAISEYTEYPMPTEIHELSAASVTFESPVSSKSATAWLGAKPSETMNSKALLLQKYNTDAGLTPLASEWWHFEDLACLELGECSGSTGEYFIQKNYSTAPLFQQSIN
jgi:D-alanyl-D-alanine dipeptidase